MRTIEALKFSFNSTYFMEMYRGNAEHKVKIYESEWWVDQPDHKFETIEMTDTQLCNGKETEVIYFKFWRRNQFLMTNSEVCSCTTSLNALQMHNSTMPIALKDESGKKVAELMISATIKDLPRYIDYLQAGYKMNLIGAIDFTYSNGHPSSPNSLHCLDNGKN